ncbi:MAG: aldo/keto reductase [Proteobacteria bacterium]|nr:aldo/keto reductase [Pseudomonadota bacterium]
MKYRKFGNTGANVSILGFGAMRLPMTGEGENLQVDMEKSVPMIQKGLDAGINYIDTAWAYLNETSEKVVGEAIAGRDRSKLYVSTKNPMNTEPAEYRKRLDVQLKKLKTDYIDFYHIHGLSWNVYQYKAKPKGYMDDLRKAKEEGLIRHISFSSHDTPANIMKIIDTGEFESMLVQYNLLHRYNEAAMANAAEKGMGVTIMGPVGGGRITFLSELKPREGRSLAELTLRFVFANPHVGVALSGMNTLEMIVENAKTADHDEPLSQIEKEDVNAMLGQIKGLEDLYCTGCGYCMPCPNKVDIPTNLLLLNYIRVYGSQKNFKDGNIQLYHKRMVPNGEAAEFCIECGECLDKCPQNIPISDRMKDVAAELAMFKPAG